MKAYNKDTKVKWSWGNGEATGKVKEHYLEDVTKTIKWNEVTREASSDEPAYLIEQDDWDEALKSHSEIEEA